MSIKNTTIRALKVPKKLFRFLFFSAKYELIPIVKAPAGKASKAIKEFKDE
jgi:hypothetical protein